jgi:hypothetical protein
MPSIGTEVRRTSRAVAVGDHTLPLRPGDSVIAARCLTARAAIGFTASMSTRPAIAVPTALRAGRGRACTTTSTTITTTGLVR